ncbi:Transmembrane protein [Quillaja saponaria]|uniref:Transmembrane protein n=1 Tax=Quillaja saponaria TaxID=32244 RepID=A0AAD7LXZ4_QUISA|nr:Transmembrane protein [Quillaja saponaria]
MLSPNVATMLLFFSLMLSFSHDTEEDEREREKFCSMAGNEDWKKMADTHKMKPEDVKAAGVEGSKRPPGQNPGGVLHQRRSLPFNTTTMAIGGLLIIAAIGYSVIYVKKKPEASATDVAKVSIGVANPEDTRPRK